MKIDGKQAIHSWIESLSDQEYIQFFYNIERKEFFEGVNEGSVAYCELLSRRRKIFIRLLYN